MVAQQRKHKLPSPLLSQLIRCFPAKLSKKAKKGQLDKRLKQSGWSNSTVYPVLTSVEVHACTGVSSRVWGRDSSPNIRGSVRICGEGEGVRVCRLMDSGAGARDWLQCRSRALCADAQRVHRPRNIISADWHFAFATINIAPRPRNFEFYRDDFVRFPRRCELYIYI